MDPGIAMLGSVIGVGVVTTGSAEVTGGPWTISSGAGDGIGSSGAGSTVGASASGMAGSGAGEVSGAALVSGAGVIGRFA
jgi:hypothetical protein